MNMATRNWTTLLLLLGVISLIPAAIGAPAYSISATPSIDIPEQTTTYQGTEYTVDSITRLYDGESVNINADAPSDATYDINLRGPDNEIISSERKSGDSIHTIEYFGTGEAGTYAVTIYDDNDPQTVHPVVLAGYEISVQSPDSVRSGDSVTVEADLTEQSIAKHSNLDYVELIIGNEDVQVQQRLESQGDSTYATSVSTTDLDTGTYNMYVTVRGDEDVRKRAEFLAVSDQIEITITEQSTESSGDSTDGGSTGGSVGGTEQTATATERTTTSTPTATLTTTESPTQERTQTETEDSSRPLTPSDSPTPVSSDQFTQSETSDDSGVINPATSEPKTTTAGSGPGFTVVLAIMVVLLSAYLGMLRS